MKRSPRILSSSIASFVAMIFAASGAKAQTNGTWLTLAGGSWTTATNWTGGAVAGGTDALADFSTLNITATATVTLDGARTVGTLRFGDLTTVSNDWALNTGTGGPLTMDVTSGPAKIELIVNRTATIGAVLAGSDGISVTNGTGTLAAGTLILSGANTFTGGLSIAGAIVQLNNALAAGSDPITLSTATPVSRLLINGGVSIANAVSFGNTTGVAGFGVLQQTGTGIGRINGAISVTGAPTAGGHFVGGTAVGNELSLMGPITATVGLTQREGRVIYGGGGTGWTSLLVTNTALVGANDGMSTAAIVTLGGSGNASLDLNGFNQALAGVSMGNTGGTFTGTVNLGAKTLTMTGNLTALSSSQIANNAVNGSGGGTIFFPEADRNIIVNENAGYDELTINGAIISAPLGVNKSGSGVLSMLGATVNGKLNVVSGTLGTGRLTTVGSFSASALNLGFATSLRMKVGAVGDLITVTDAGGLTTDGLVNVNLSQIGGLLANGTYPLINYKGTSPGLAAFTLSPLGHSVSTLIDTGSSIALKVTGNQKVAWDGGQGTAWNTFSETLKFVSNGGITAYAESDDISFDDNPAGSIVDITAPVNPTKVTFTNSTATTYSISGAGGIIGMTGITKTGNGTVILRTPNFYTGPTVVSAGTLELDHDTATGLVLSGTSGVSVAAGSTLKLTRDDGNITFDRAISGTGTVIIDPHTAAGAAVREVAITGNNTGFSGLWKLSSSQPGTSGGSFRTNAQMTPTTLGTAAVQVDNGAQLWVAGNQTYVNPVTITGTGYSEVAGGTPIGLGVLSNGVYLGAGTALFGYSGIGAIRMEAGAVFSGGLTVNGNAKIMAFNATGTVSGPISSTSAADTLVIGGGTSATSVVFTGANTYGKTLVNGGSGTSAVVQTLQIGANGTTGTLGAGEVVLYGNSAASAFLRFSRSDGYTLAAGQNILGAASASADFARTAVGVNTTGAGLTLNGNTLDLSDGITGGNLHIAGNSGANGVTGASLNLTGATVIDVGNVYIGEQANFGGTLNVGGTSTVNIINQVRVGHYGTESSTLNLSSGSVTVAVPATATFPFTTGATEQIGGIYLGVDGSGTLNQSGGTLSTNFIVLDNRVENLGGINVTNAADTYAISGGTLLLRSAYGIISRFNSTAVQLNGGTIQAATGVSPNLDSNKISVGGPVTLDTNGAGTFTLYGPLAGTGTVSLIGGGTLRTQDGTGATTTAAGGGMLGGSLGSASLNVAAGSILQANRTGQDVWTGALSGAGTFNKINTGTLTLSGNSSTFTGPANVSAGRLNLPNSFGASAVVVSDGAALGGEATLASLTMGSAGATSLFIDPATPGALSATTLALNGTSTVLDFSAAPAGNGSYTALNFTTRTGPGTFSVANAANYRVAPVLTETATRVSVDVTGTKALTWVGGGTAPATWDLNSSTNWKDAGAVADKFFTGDTVTFGDDPTPTDIVVTSGVSPWKTSVTSNLNNFTFTSSASGIAGIGNLEKSGTSTLTLTGPNTYSGRTLISGGGQVTIASATSLGNAAPGNSIAISGGSRLNMTAAMDLGVNRGIAVGAGGGTLVITNAATQTVTIPGSLSGTGPLTLSGGAPGAPVFVLSGDNSGFSGNITVDSFGGGATILGGTTLRLLNSNSLTAGTLTLINPTTGVNGVVTTLDLPNVSVPAAVKLVMNSTLAGTLSYRSQINASGVSAFNGGIELNGTSISQFASAAAGVLNLNGPTTDLDNEFTGIMFLRGAGNGVINGKITLPTGTVSKTDAGTWQINSTGNDWAATGVYVGSVKLGATNALSTRAPVTMGQNDASAPILDLNGFNQTVGGYIANLGTAGNKTITNSVAATPVVLTINQSTDSTVGALGILTGALGLTKTGAGNLTFQTANSTFNGPIRVESGILTGAGTAAATGANGPLGVANLAGRSISVASGATLSFTSNNIFGNGIGNNNLPVVSLNGGSLTSTRYNAVGDLVLSGGTVTQSVTDSGNYEGFQFRGNISVTGTAPSFIDSPIGKANHLNANTLFDVADVTASSATDLTISAPLRNQSADFGSATGGLTKAGAGTLELSGFSSYTGPTTVTAGTLNVSGSIGGSPLSVNGGSLVGNGGTLGAATIGAAGTLAPGAGLGTLNFNGSLTLAGTAAFEINKTGLVLSSDLASVNGLMTFGGLLRVTASGDTLAKGDFFTLFGAQSYAGSFASFQLPALGSGLAWDIQSLGTSGVLTVVPEPGTAASLLTGFGLLLGLRRRRAMKA